MANIYVKNPGGTPNSGTYRGTWAATTAYAVGDRVGSLAATNYWMYECTQSGTSGGTEPTWDNVDGSTSNPADGTCTWTSRKPDSWADATYSWLRAFANDAGGDNIYVSEDFYDVVAAAVTLTVAGTLASPTNVISATWGSDPVTYSYGAQLTTSGANAITINGGSAYFRGINISAGSGSTTGADLSIATTDEHAMVFDDCRFQCQNANAASGLNLGSRSSTEANSRIELINCKYTFSATSQGIDVGYATIKILGGQFQNTSAITTLFEASGIYGGLVEVDGFDASQMANTATLVTGAIGQWKFSNVTLPPAASITALVGGTTSIGTDVVLTNCARKNDPTRTVTGRWAKSGNSYVVRGPYRIGGAKDIYDSPYAICMAGMSSNSEAYPNYSLPIYLWNDVIDRQVTLTIHYATDGGAVDSMQWLDVMYPSSSTNAVHTLASTRKIYGFDDANTAESTEQWKNGPLNSHAKLSVTVTPRRKGYIKIVFGALWDVVYFCPKVEVTYP